MFFVSGIALWPTAESVQGGEVHPGKAEDSGPPPEAEQGPEVARYYLELFQSGGRSDYFGDMRIAQFFFWEGVHHGVRVVGQGVGFNIPQAGQLPASGAAAGGPDAAVGVVGPG